MKTLYCNQQDHSSCTAFFSDQVRCTCSCHPSERQVRILQLASNGISDKDIARILAVQVRTIKKHFAAIVKKLQTTDRAHAITLATKRKLIQKR